MPVVAVVWRLYGVDCDWLWSNVHIRIRHRSARQQGVVVAVLQKGPVWSSCGMLFVSVLLPAIQL